MMSTKNNDIGVIFRQRYGLLGSERLWRSLDEVAVLGHENVETGSTYGHTGQAY
jgi:hypothetical protein